MDPFVCKGSCEATLTQLSNLLEATPGITVTVSTASYLHAECRSAFLRFVDDLELMVDRENAIVHVRSASRVGSWDLGANRRRVETLRRQFKRLRD